jgi:hypothetical protein
VLTLNRPHLILPTFSCFPFFTKPSIPSLLSWERWCPFPHPRLTSSPLSWEVPLWLYHFNRLFSV